jgi:hypothetical protein
MLGFRLIALLCGSTIDAAIALAIDKGWMVGEGAPPHSVCLKNDG